MKEVVLYIRTNPNEYIINQLNELEAYCKTNNLTITKKYIDNGYSACDYNRASLKYMLYDISLGKINTILITELKIIGRDASKTMYYLNLFRVNNIRLISIKDKFDNKNIDDDIYYHFNEIMEALYGNNTNNK